MTMSDTDLRRRLPENEDNPPCKRFSPGFGIGRQLRDENQNILAGNLQNNWHPDAVEDVIVDGSEQQKGCAQKNVQSFPLVMASCEQVEPQEMCLERKECAHHDSCSLSAEHEGNFDGELVYFSSSAAAVEEQKDCALDDCSTDDVNLVCPSESECGSVILIDKSAELTVECDTPRSASDSAKTVTSGLTEESARSRNKSTEVTVELEKTSGSRCKLAELATEPREVTGVLEVKAKTEPAELDCKASDAVQIHNIPNEMLLHLFTFLTPRELCRHVTGVCRQWHDLAYHRCLWTRLDMTSLGVTGQQLCQVIQHVSGAVRYLNIAELQGLSDTLVTAVMKNCPELVHLDVSGVRNLSVSMIRSVLSHCRGLQSLSMSRCSRLNYRMMQEIVSKAGPRLKRISLDGSSLADDSLNLMMRYIQGMTHLSLDQMPRVSEGTIHKLMSKYCNTLEALSLDGRNLTDWGISPLATCNRLWSLSISCCQNLTQRTFHTLTKVEHLNTLVLRKGQQFHAWVLMEYFSTGILAGLIHLDLTECAQLDDDGLQAISQTCADNLKTLCLRWCVCISDESLSHVASNCIHMVRMELTGLHRLQGSWLPTAVETMNNLSFITFQMCQNVRVSVMEKAVRDQPRLTILNYYGEKVVYRSQHTGQSF